MYSNKRVLTELMKFPLNIHEIGNAYVAVLDTVTLYSKYNSTIFLAPNPCKNEINFIVVFKNQC